MHGKMDMVTTLRGNKSLWLHLKPICFFECIIKSFAFDFCAIPWVVSTSFKSVQCSYIGYKIHKPFFPRPLSSAMRAFTRRLFTFAVRRRGNNFLFSQESKGNFDASVCVYSLSNIFRLALKTALKYSGHSKVHTLVYKFPSRLTPIK